MRTQLIALAIVMASPFSALAASADSGIGLGAEVSTSATPKESDSSANVSSQAEVKAEFDRVPGDVRQRGEPKDEVKARPRRDLRTPRPPREVSIPGAGGRLEGSGAIK